MFNPKYTITNQLLSNIKKISTLVNGINNRRFPNIILAELEKTARAVSSYASTSIEGNPLPLTQVKRIIKNQPSNVSQSEKEVLNYNKALGELNKKLKTSAEGLSLNLILQIQKTVTKELLPEFESGRLRKKPVLVNKPGTGKVVYLPPDSKDSERLIKDLIEFVNASKDSIDPLILAGIFHKQMVIIHPFTDGNGRTTRLAAKVLLAEMGLDTFNLFSFENFYNKNVTQYFQNVGEYGNYYDLKDKIDFTSWLEYFTEGIIDELLRVQKILPEIGVNPESGLLAYHLKILEHIRKNGFIADRNYAKLVKRAKATRSLDFKKLIDLDLIERKGKGRATYYILKGL